MSKMKELDEIAQSVADVTMELMHDSIDWQLSDFKQDGGDYNACLLYTSPSPRDGLLSRMPSSA